jgi:poly(hydroxyalkanoate) granule-associated protein
MPKKSAPSSTPNPDDAQQIWLAGLGAFSQAQKKGTEALQKMLQDGLNMQRQAQQTAEQKIAEATRKMSAMAQQIHPAAKATPKATASAPMQAPWEGLEGLFDQRVARALERMGWGSPERLSELQHRMEALEAKLNKTTASRKAPTPSVAKAARKPRNG